MVLRPSFPPASWMTTRIGSVLEVVAAASGNLTLHGQTRPIQIKLTGRLRGDVLVVTGSIEITFADFGIQKPESFKVLSVADHGTLEVQLFLSQT